MFINVKELFPRAVEVNPADLKKGDRVLAHVNLSDMDEFLSFAEVCIVENGVVFSEKGSEYYFSDYIFYKVPAELPTTLGSVIYSVTAFGGVPYSSGTLLKGGTWFLAGSNGDYDVVFPENINEFEVAFVPEA